MRALAQFNLSRVHVTAKEITQGVKRNREGANRPYSSKGPILAFEPESINLDIPVGKPVVRGTRFAVDFIIDLMAQEWSESEVLRS